MTSDSNPSANDAYALPNVETFRAWYGDCPFCQTTLVEGDYGDYYCDECQNRRMPDDIKRGWFYWSPGCLLLGSELHGPFKTEDEAIADAREYYGTGDEDEDTDADDLA